MPELTLFFSPRACSLACHIALEESGLPFTAKMVKIREGQHKTHTIERRYGERRLPTAVPPR